MNLGMQWVKIGIILYIMVFTTMATDQNILHEGTWSKWKQETKGSNSKCIGARNKIGCTIYKYNNVKDIVETRTTSAICKYGEFHENLYEFFYGCIDGVNRTIDLFDHDGKLTASVEEIVQFLKDKEMWDVGAQSWTKCELLRGGGTGSGHGHEGFRKYRGEEGGESYSGTQDFVYVCPLDDHKIWRKRRRHCCAGKFVPVVDSGVCSTTCGKGVRQMRYVCVGRDSNITDVFKNDTRLKKGSKNRSLQVVSPEACDLKECPPQHKCDTVSPVFKRFCEAMENNNVKVEKSKKKGHIGLVFAILGSEALLILVAAVCMVLYNIHRMPQSFAAILSRNGKNDRRRKKYKVGKVMKLSNDKTPDETKLTTIKSDTSKSVLVKEVSNV